MQNNPASEPTAKSTPVGLAFSTGTVLALCFAPNSDRESRLLRPATSALLPKAEMCGALADVCYGPKADIHQWPDLLETLPDEAVNFNRAHDCDWWRL
jgi:hypothetical protein